MDVQSWDLTAMVEDDLAGTIWSWDQNELDFFH